ncbi:kinase-like domain-containing protein [Favolaschia claudopus]|uniref:Kinase-like domain-containing protein n=1 Tax=Favolaschia claudopus TaxID=2862362 RepID=A0AAV9ZA89_9AGAR
MFHVLGRLTFAGALSFLVIQLWTRRRVKPSDALDLLPESQDSRQSKDRWLSASDFFPRQKLVPFGSPAYESFPDPPRLPPRRAFVPQEDEDFVHRLWKVNTRPRVSLWIAPRAEHWMALDRFGRNVYLKLCPRYSEEWQILEYLADSTPSRHPWNRTIPTRGFFRTRRSVVIVQACWGTGAFSPTWDSLRTRLFLARQLLQGLAYMHMMGVAHGDLHPENIVCNHEDVRFSRKSGTSFQSTFDFQLAFIDFENSVRVPAGHSQAITTVFGIPPEPFAAPELIPADTVDLFAADVFSAGQLLQFELNGNTADSGHDPPTVPGYLALIAKMTARVAPQRPSALDALGELEQIICDHI